MKAAILILIASLIAAGVFVVTACVLAYRLLSGREQANSIRLALAWLGKGLLLPLVLWTVMNLGISWNLQPFMPQVQAAQSGGGPWFPALLRVVAAGLFIISSDWAAVTLGWSLLNAGKGLEGDFRAAFRSTCWTWSRDGCWR